MARPVYQLQARGHSMNGWAFRARSRAVFARRGDAEAHRDEFVRRCTDAERFECAYEDGLEVTIAELELHE